MMDSKRYLDNPNRRCGLSPDHIYHHTLLSVSPGYFWGFLHVLISIYFITFPTVSRYSTPKNIVYILVDCYTTRVLHLADYYYRIWHGANYNPLWFFCVTLCPTTRVNSSINFPAVTTRSGI